MRLTLVLLSFLLLTSCSNLTPLKLLGGGGVSTAANVQAGKTNNQTLGTNETYAPTVSLRPNARVDTVDQSKETVNNTYVSPLMLILLILGWLAPSPSEIARGIRSLWRRKR